MSKVAPIAAMAALCLLASPSPTRADDLRCVSTTFRLIGKNDRVCVSAFDDPKVPGVACHVSQARTGGLSGTIGLAEDPSRFSIACRQVGPIATDLGTLADGDVDNLKSNLNTGGLLLADAGCTGTTAWVKFDDSFRKMVEKLFPDQKLVPIPLDDPLFSAKNNGGTPLTQVRCRREKPDGSGPEAELHGYAPFLEGIKIDGRWVVIYSKYDIGCALEGHKSADCLGHDRDSAMRLASAVVLYSLRR